MHFQRQQMLVTGASKKVAICFFSQIKIQLFSILLHARPPRLGCNESKTFISPGLATGLDLAARQPNLPCSLGAAEEVMMTVSIVTGSRKAPASVHAQTYSGAVGLTRSLTDNLEVPVLAAGHQLQLTLAGVSLPVRATHGGLGLASALIASLRIARICLQWLAF